MSVINTDINEDKVFLLYPFKKNKIIVDITIHIINVGMVGLKPHPTIIIRSISKPKLKYMVRNVLKPLLPPIRISRTNNMIDSAVIIFLASFYIKVS